MESAQIDGANDLQTLVRIAIHLIKPTLAVLALYYAVGHWNSYFNAFLYLSKDELYPLQILLRKILLLSQIQASDLMDDEMAEMMQGMADLMKYSLIVFATLPILCVYPFAQKYFVKGVMLGSLKE